MCAGNQWFTGISSTSSTSGGCPRESEAGVCRDSRESRGGRNKRKITARQTSRATLTPRTVEPCSNPPSGNPKRHRFHNPSHHKRYRHQHSLHPRYRQQCHHRNYSRHHASAAAPQWNHRPPRQSCAGRQFPIGCASARGREWCAW